MLKLAHTQSSGFAGKDINVCTHGYTDISTDVIGAYSCHPVGNYNQHGRSWNKLKGYVHTSVPAQYEKYRNIGVWRCDGDAHLSAHEKYMNWSIGVQRSNQLERWGQCNLRYPSNVMLSRRQASQGGVVDPRGHQWLARRSEAAVTRAVPVSVIKLKHLHMYCECCRESLLSLHGSGAGCSLPIRLRVVGLNLSKKTSRRSVPAIKVRRETSAESWSVRSSSRNCE